jgi:hypothetical protein
MQTTGKTSAVLVTILGLLALAVTGSDCDVIFEGHVQSWIANADDQHLAPIETWLQTVKIIAGSSLPSVLEQLKEACDKETDSNHKKHYQFLISLATTDADNQCQHDLFEFFLAIYKQVLERKLTDLLDFMDYYGKEKFSRCSE